MTTRVFVNALAPLIGQRVTLKGWVRFLRTTKSTTFIVLQDLSGTAQLVGGSALSAGLKREDAVVVVGTVRADKRAPNGVEVDVESLEVVGVASHQLPFSSGGDLAEVGQETVLDFRPLSLRTARGQTIFQVQAALIEEFRSALRRRGFTEIVSSKIVAGGTEGGANLFSINYFDKVAYLAQSPQFYKEHGVVGLERVFETAHVYRAEPHATSRHLTEYYSLDLEMGFIDGPEDVIQVEREILTEMFAAVRTAFGDRLSQFDAYLPSLEKAPIWEFSECLDRLKSKHGRTDLAEDLDAEAERQLCAMAEEETGVSAVFVLGFPIGGRPFYTHVRPDGRTASGFDLLFRGLEITTGGQRLHQRADLEASLRRRSIDPEVFEPHLRMFDLGMPPHGGLAIGAERLTTQVLGLKNVREATLYPRDMNRVTP